MAHTRAQEHRLQLAQVEAIAASRAKGAERELLIGFIRGYYELAPEEILSSLHPPELEAIAAGHLAFARSRRKNQRLVRAFRPTLKKNGWGADVGVLETVVPDCPFLVDTVAMAVRAQGGTVRWLVHPVLELARDGKGKITAVGSAGEGEGPHESLIHLHFDGLEEPGELDALVKSVEATLKDVATVVADYPAIRDRLKECIHSLDTCPPGLDADEIAEVQALLSWLDEEHFTFLGYAESQVVKTRGRAHFEHVPGSGLGLQRGRDGSIDLIAPAAEIDKYARSRRPLIVTKANTRSHIHHDEVFDSISVKKYDAKGKAVGTCRFLGLFSSEVYNSLPRRIPYLRRKIQWVMDASRLRGGSHAGKQLQEILDTLPRDELFQTSEQELYETAMGVRTLRETQRLRLFLRRDRYGRFFSCLVYLHRDQYSADKRERMGQTLKELLDGTELEHFVHFQRDGLARVQFIVRTRPGARTALKTAEIESRLIEATRSWDDALRDYLMRILPDEQALALARRFHGAFPASYREQTEPVEAATDLQYLDRLDAEEPLLVRLLELQAEACDLRLKLYVRGAPVTLSAVLPLLENFGLKVQTQHPCELSFGKAGSLWIQDFDLLQTGVCILTSERMRNLFEEAFLRVWNGELENDGINQLILSAGLDWRGVTLVRTLCKYLLQTGLPYSQPYIETILADNAPIAQELVKLFAQRFDPQVKAAEREQLAAVTAAAIRSQLDKVSSLDADRVLRAFLSVIEAGLRTNYYQRDADGRPKPAISIKLDPARIPELPQPRPMFEAFVYSPEVEGIHLRGGRVARGGLRWSDRREDFRTEVLGLVKAQMVKNAVIVPVGAKGGFVVKKPLDGLDRDGVQQAGIHCYKTFLRGLLDITDNTVKDKLVPPRDVVRHDGDDPYLVVAADKGTASFSDIANGVAAEYDFWLGDAFASGGSAGYDHKAMGITARGAWESVKRAFREIGRDCQREDFTVVGIGDMAGDVFGNGMLLSEHIKLIAAFNHLHIFIDPDPDPAKSFAERERLFQLPRSSWQDYDGRKISKGGGIFERSAKQIKLTPEARKALGIEASSLTPTQLIHEILKAPVDLLWNGGIGTYVKARHESHMEVGDRANDGLRVNGEALRCQLIGEGGNLGLTQLGRIEYALNGGRVITDFNDNAGGVNSSDREVNIKIPLNRLMAGKSLSRRARDKLLASMTGDVAAAVLRDSYLQTQAISLMQRQAVPRLEEHANFMRMLEREGLLNRAIEFLPDDENLKDRRAERRGLTAPEMAVLVSYGKLSLYDAVLDSSLPDDEELADDLLAYFPPALREAQPKALAGHRLRREIVATLTTNETVNRMGVTFAHRAAEDLGVTADGPVRAYLAARDSDAARGRFEAVEALDGKLPVDTQYELLERISGLLKHAALWLLRQGLASGPLGEPIQRFGPAREQLEACLDEVLPPVYRQEHGAFARSMIRREVPTEVAQAFANHHVLGAALDIAALGEEAGFAVPDTARAYFDIGARLAMPWLLAQVNALRVEGRWQALARNNLRDETQALHRAIVSRALASPGKTAQARVERWAQDSRAQLEFAERRLSELEALENNDFASLSVALRELQRLSL